MFAHQEKSRGCNSGWLQCIAAVADERKLPSAHEENAVVSLSKLLGGPEGQGDGTQASIPCGLPLLWRSYCSYLVVVHAPFYSSLGFGVDHPRISRARKGVTWIFLVVLLCFPALVFAQFLLITVIPPKYVRKGQSVVTIF